MIKYVLPKLQQITPKGPFNYTNHMKLKNKMFFQKFKQNKKILEELC